MSSGIADTGRHWAGSDSPTPLPVQALDHATGYLMAATVLSALTAATQGNPAPQARLSLARTAALLADLSKDAVGPDITSAQNSDFATLPENSGWGIGQRLTAPLSLSTTSMSWDLPASQLGTSGAIWL